MLWTFRLSKIAYCLSISVVFVIYAAVGGAYAQGSCPFPGMQFRWSDTADSLISVGPSPTIPNACTYKNSRTLKEITRILGVFNVDGTLIKPNLDKFQSLIPPAVGKRTSFQSSGASNTGSDGTWTHTITIEKQETLTTPAGTFSALVILLEEKGFGTGGLWERRYWYIPSIGVVAKFAFKNVRGNPPPNYPKDYELVEVRAR